MEADERQREFRARLYEWADQGLREFPWREDSASPYDVFVAEVLLQRTFAEKVEGVYLEFLNRYPTPAALNGAGVDELTDLLRPLGLHNRRAAAFEQLGASLVEMGGVPQTEEALLQLSRVGPYAANATLCFGYGECRAIVDANVVRIYDRVFDLGVDGPKDDAVWEFAEEMLPDEKCQEYNLALLDFGALVCTARGPKCETCPMREFCAYYAETT